MGPDEKAWDWMRRLAPYTRYRNISSFIREGIDLLLKREDAQPSGWIVGQPRRGVIGESKVLQRAHAL